MYCIDFYTSFFEVPEDRVHLFFLLDGLGMNQMPRLGADGWFARHFSHEMQSVFPSTTAVALSALASRRQPGELGITGWSTYLPEEKRISNVLISKEFGSDVMDTSIVPSTIQVPSALGHDNVVTINPDPFVTEPYAFWTTGGGRGKAYGYADGDKWDEKTNAKHWSKVVRQAFEEARPGSLIYTYIPYIDGSSHKHGWDAPQTRDCALSVQSDLEELCAWLSEQDKAWSLAATADHGLINISRDKYFLINDKTSWQKELECPFSGEGRNPVFHVKPGREDAFKQAFSQSPQGPHYELLRPEELVERGLFPGGISPKARPRWGSFVGLAKDHITMEYVFAGKEPKNMIAVHGGNDSDERRVPLFRQDG